MNKEKFLPIGSVVLLKGGSHKLMIIGYCSTHNVNDKKIYDYVGCFFPEGILGLDQSLIFNHSDIKDIYYVGYSDNESKDFNKKLELFIKNNVDSNGLLRKTPEELIKEVKQG